MSRGFVREEDQEEIPIVPPRADLPDGVTNYVTQEGMDALIKEREDLIAERDQLGSINENEKRITSNYINAKIQLLQNRIATAKIVDLTTQPRDEVRFGATVTLRIGTEKNLQKYQIVGVDEADISKGKIAFISPIARLLTNKKEGEHATLKLVHKNRNFEVVKIEYL